MSVRQEIEIAELQQALFDVYVALGEDTDGIPDGPTFARTVSPYPECIVEAARLTRKEYEDETDALTAQLQAAQARLTTAEAIISRARECVREEYPRSQVLAVLNNPLPPVTPTENGENRG